jgi:hypothetical protein
MSWLKIGGLLVCLFCLSATPARAVDPWQRAAVLPKSSQVRLMGYEHRVTSRDAGSVFQIAWPASVEKIDGQWIFIRDEGGYSSPPVAGWVRKRDMLRASGEDVPVDESPGKFYIARIQEEPQNPEVAVWHWLRGIYFESPARGEQEIAIADYCAAVHFACGEPDPDSVKVCQVCSTFASADPAVPPSRTPEGVTIPADAFLRLGRLLAQRPDSQDYADACFRSAQKQFLSQRNGLASTVPAQLYVEWGKTALEKYRNSKAATDASSATNWFKQAAQMNAHWSVPYYESGMVYLAEVGNSGASVEQVSLKAAIQAFGQAIRCAPNSPDAFMERGEALRRLAGKMDSKAGHPNPPLDLSPLATLGNMPPVTKLAVGAPQDGEKVKVSLLNEAAYSADYACRLKSYRESKGLEILANILADHAELLLKKNPPDHQRQAEAQQFYDQAADYASDAALFSKFVEDQHRLLQLQKHCECWKKCLEPEAPQPISPPVRTSGADKAPGPNPLAGPAKNPDNKCDCDKKFPRLAAPPPSTRFTPRIGRSSYEENP